MKIASRIFSLLILIAFTTLYGCKKHNNEKKTEEQTQLEKLKASWQIQSASDASGDRTTDFDNMVLTLSGNYAEGGTYSYSLTGERPNPSPWPDSGTWQFGSPKTSKIIRDPGDTGETEMSYSVTESELTIEFNIPENSDGWAGSAGRVQSVTGSWTFVFTKL